MKQTHHNAMTKLEQRVNSFAQIKNGQVEKHEKAYFVTHDNSAALWEGARKRPTYYYRFKTEQERDKWVRRQKEAITRRDEEAKAYQRKKQKENEALKVGQIMYDSWGWEQTNIDWYMIVRKTGSSVWLQQIGANVTETGFMSGNSTPNTDKTIGEPFMRRIGKHGIKISSHRGCLMPYKGEPTGCSWYA